MNVTELNVSDNISLNVSVKNLILKNESINDIINISLENITQEDIITENITIKQNSNTVINNISRSHCN